MLHQIGVEDNVSFYDNKKGKHDVILDMVWARDFQDMFIKQLSGMTSAVKAGNDRDAEIEESQQITLMDCFQEFRKPEMLDDDNKWYCNKCKDHVRATKQMELFKAPPILVVNLKRFK